MDTLRASIGHYYPVGLRATSLVFHCFAQAFQLYRNKYRASVYGPFRFP